jgi:hypothetical protein
MMRPSFIAALALTATLAALPAAAELEAHLAPLAPFVGRAYTAHMSPPGAEPAVVDVQLWEEILGGKGVRVTHSINGGDYGGQSLFTWDETKQSIIYFYATTASFHTVGTLTAAGDSVMTLEQVVGEAGDITEVRGVTHRTADGMVVRTQRKVRDQWLPDRSTTYVETPGAVPTFR